MKKAINNQGVEVEVDDFVVVRTENGINYLLTPEEQAAYDAALAEAIANPPKPPIPNVTPRQARLALLQQGLLNAVDASVVTPEQHIWWEYSTVFERDNPVLDNIAASLGLTSEQVDSLFILAATL